MKNTMISNKEREALEKVYSAVDEFVNVHEQITFEQVSRSTKVEKIHILLFMDLVKDLLISAKSIKGLLDEDENSFIEAVTDGGKMTLDEVEKKLMHKMLVDMFMNE